MRTDSGRMRTDGGRIADGCARTAHGQRTDNAHGQRTDSARTADGQCTDSGRTADDGARTLRSVRRPCANRATLLFYCCFDTFVTKIQCPCASVRCLSAVRAHPSAVRPLSVRFPFALSVRRAHGFNRKPGRTADGMRTDCARMRTANNKTCRPSWSSSLLF